VNFLLLKELLFLFTELIAQKRGGDELDNRVYNDKNRVSLLREDCRKGDYNSVYQKHDGKCLLAVTADCASAPAWWARTPRAVQQQELLQLPPTQLVLEEVLQPSRCPGWVWTAEAFTAGALPSLALVAGTYSARGHV